MAWHQWQMPMGTCQYLLHLTRHCASLLQIDVFRATQLRWAGLPVVCQGSRESAAYTNLNLTEMESHAIADRPDADTQYVGTSKLTAGACIGNATMRLAFNTRTNRILTAALWMVGRLSLLRSLCLHLRKSCHGEEA